MKSSTASAVTPLLPETTQFDWVSLDELEAPIVKAGAAYWLSLLGDRRFPSRHEIVPRQIAGLMPYMTLLSVIDGGADFAHRIVGDVMVRAFNVSIQNRRFSEIAAEAPDFIARCFPLFRQVVDTRKPVAWHAVSGRDADTVAFTYSEVVLLPLGIDDMVDHILGFGSHHTRA